MNNAPLVKVLVWLQSVDFVFDFLNDFGLALEVCLNYTSYVRADYRLADVFYSAMLNLTPFLPFVHFEF